MLVTIIQHTYSSSSSQSRNKTALVSIFSKAGENPDLAAGLQYFLKTYVARSDIVASKQERKSLRLACDVVGERLSAFIAGQDGSEVDDDTFSD